MEALLVRGAAHFYASSYRFLLRQPSAPYRVAAHPTIARCRKRSGRSRLQHWIKHAMATQATTEHVVALESDEPTLDHSDGLLDDSSEEIPSAKVLS